jgi:hypothetical protein
MAVALVNVRFRGQSGHVLTTAQGLLMTHLRHWPDLNPAVQQSSMGRILFCQRPEASCVSASCRASTIGTSTITMTSSFYRLR